MFSSLRQVNNMVNYHPTGDCKMLEVELYVAFGIFVMIVLGILVDYFFEDEDIDCTDDDE